MLFKNIHIGHLIQTRVNETNFSIERLTNFLQCSEDDIENMYNSESLHAELLLKWSKLLQYDFFRMYSQHLLLYSPPSSPDYYKNIKQQKTELPEFRKNIYTIEIIEFILDLVKSNKKTKQEVIEEYRIPKTTLYKWLNKY
ncbi:transposase [Chryseobacterium viscerum]|uniref:Transposase n=1 Tax=Chryseobacterium viscerum TaxID=1037377 RepID=A0A5N4BJV5_9FLAO|nr:transposase [Chryseobacterium viscerum]KAB1228693.1 transposase [Chryseobacterium viscerum]